MNISALEVQEPFRELHLSLPTPIVIFDPGALENTFVIIVTRTKVKAQISCRMTNLFFCLKRGGL
jgi:hypothetical protein